MFKIGEDELYNLRQLKNKVAFIRKLSELGGGNSLDITSEQMTTIFTEIEDELFSFLSKIENTTQDEPST